MVSRLRFARPIDIRRHMGSWLPICVLAILVFALYFRTLAPTITWKNDGADSGDLVTAAAVGGIPHPPGYPVYTALAQLFLLVPLGDPAYRVNLLSASSATVAVLLLYAIFCAYLPRETPARKAIAATVALWFASAPLFWSQAIIAEVYTFSILLSLCVFGGLLLWASESQWLENGERWKRYIPLAAAMTMGLGLAHHITIILLLPAAAILLWRKITWRRGITFLTVAFIVGLSLSLTLVLRAWNFAAVSWGDPRTLGQWWWVVSAQLYRGFVFGLPWGDYPGRLAVAAKLLLEQYGPLGAFLGLWGASELLRRSPRMGLATLATFVSYSVFAIGYSSRDSDVYLIFPFLVFAVWIAEGLGVLLRVASRTINSRSVLPRSTLALLVLAGFTLPAWNIAANYARMDLSHDTEALDYAQAVFGTVPNHALVITAGDEHTFALWYYRYVIAPQSQVLVVVAGLVPEPWYRGELVRNNSNWVWPPGTGEDTNLFLSQLVAQNLGRHPAYWTYWDPELQDRFRFDSVGLLYRVESIRQNEGTNKLRTELVALRWITD